MRLVVRAGFALAVLTTSLALAFAYYASFIPEGEPWLAGDWLINYADGYVRRGLFGELFLRFAPPGAAGLWALLGFQAAVYAVVLAYCLGVLHRARWSWSSIALICSPAALPFIGWDTDGGFRKEILWFLALALLAWARPRRNTAAVVALTAASLAVFTLAAFSWEATALTLPAVGYLLVAPVRHDRHFAVFRWSAAALFVAIGGFAAITGTIAHGDPGTAMAICDALREAGHFGPQLCGEVTGGIEAIGWTSERAFSDVVDAYPMYFVYFPFIALAFVPVVKAPWFRRNWGWAVLVALAMVPLYVVVTDYGRWTHMIIMALIFCITADDPRAAESKLWTPLAAILFVSLWALPHHIHAASWWSWKGLVPTLVDYSRFHLGEIMTAMGRAT